MNKDTRNLADLLEAWRNENRARCMEGDSGVEKLSNLFKAIGYKDDFGGVIHNFLADNSGAIEAILEWMEQSRVDDWADKLRDEVAPPSDDDSGTEGEE